MNYIEFTGKTVEEAVETGLSQLGLTKEQVEERIKMQFDYDIFSPNKEIVIENDGSLESFREKIKNAVDNIINL